MKLWLQLQVQVHLTSHLFVANNYEHHGVPLQCGSSIAWLLSKSLERCWGRLVTDTQSRSENQQDQVSGGPSAIETAQQAGPAAANASMPQWGATAAAGTGTGQRSTCGVEQKQQRLAAQQGWQQQQKERLARVQHQDAAAMGAGAGVAAAFIAPMAGAAYAVEDAASQYSSTLLEMVRAVQQASDKE